MRTKILKKERLSEFLTNLMTSYKVIAPKRELNDVCFNFIKDVREVNTSFTNTTISPKEFFLPQSETLLKYDIRGKVPECSLVIPETCKNLIFGIRPCDTNALLAVDKPYQDKFIDPYYLRRRAQTRMIVVACNHVCNKHAFCHSLNAGPYAKESFDLQLYDIGNRYFVEIGSEAGNDIILENNSLFSEMIERDMKCKNLNIEYAISTFPKNLNLKNISKNLVKLFEADIWEEFAKKCIRCGGCNYVCPTCHCFDVTDFTEPNGFGKRVRLWSSCMLEGFARMAGPHYVRKYVHQRMRQRIYHKFHIYPKRFGIFGCTGCGRCVTSCPVEIDLMNMLNIISYKG